jgi:hypothetical protein
MNDYFAKQKAEASMRQIRLAHLAQAVAENLEGTWSRRPPKKQANGYDQVGEYIDGPDGATLWLHRFWRDESRIVVSGDWPRTAGGQLPKRYSEKLPSITVADSRSPQAIARDITRRFLPDYQAKLAEFRQRVADDNAYHKAVADLSARMAKALGLEVTDMKTQREGQLRLYGALSGDAWGDIEVSRDSVTLKLHSLTPEKAEAILGLLK